MSAAQPAGEPCRNPILIIGTERSGSNLLRLILNAHSALVVPHPPHLVHYFRPLEHLYGDLRQDRNHALLLNDIRRLISTHIHPWAHKVTHHALAALAPGNDTISAFIGLYEITTSETGKPRWGCKSTFLIHHIDELRRRLPGVQLLLLVRDPRDVVLSSKRSVFSPCHPGLSARLWDRQQRIGWELLERLDESYILLCHYEKLLAQPEAELRRICDFLGESFETPMLRFFETDEARTSGALSESWRNTLSPILSNNSGKFLSGLSGREIALVEAICRETMERFGYRPTGAAEELAKIRVAGRPPLRHLLVNAALRLRVEARSLLHDGNHWRRWGRALLLARIRWRLRMRSLAGRWRSAE